ncbi:hypothetical protein MKW94_007770, partial [Papaver nudicaule]|nr:hypothetical protein [Papaver nudicaule]
KEVLEAKEKNKEVGSSSNVRITRKKKPANQRKDKHRGYSSAMSKKQCEKAVTACSGFEGQLESLGGKFD